LLMGTGPCPYLRPHVPLATASAFPYCYGIV
jgi:hypothetical protein